jgi:hypothetical protein
MLPMDTFTDVAGFLLVINLLLFPPLLLFGYLTYKLVVEFSKPVEKRFGQMTWNDFWPPLPPSK